MKTYYVYILECSDGSYYTGVTNNIERRLLEHTSGLNINSYTHNRRPLKLMWHIELNDINQAIELEKKIKKWSHAKKKSNDREKWEDLRLLSKKKFNKD